MRLMMLFFIAGIFSTCHSLEPCPQPLHGSATSADGVKIAYTMQGHGEMALVFIHGGFCDRGFWDHQVRFFAKDFQVVALDLAGHGESGHDRANWILDAFSRDVQAAIQKLRLRRVVLVGHSMGGPVALKAAQRMPHRVVGVIGVDTLHDADAPWNEEAWEKRLQFFRKDFRAACEAMVGEGFHPNADPAVVAWVLEKARKARPEMGIPVLELFSNYDMAAEMEKVKAPIRCVNGDLWPTHIEGNRKHAPGFDAVIMKGVGHYPMVEQPEAFSRCLAGVVRDLIEEKDEAN